MSLLHRGAHSKKRPSVYSTIAGLEEEERLMLIEPENLPEKSEVDTGATDPEFGEDREEEAAQDS